MYKYYCDFPEIFHGIIVGLMIIRCIAGGRFRSCSFLKRILMENQQQGKNSQIGNWLLNSCRLSDVECRWLYFFIMSHGALWVPLPILYKNTAHFFNQTELIYLCLCFNCLGDQTNTTHTVAIWTFAFHKKSGFVKVILKANFKPAYRPVS